MGISVETEKLYEDIPPTKRRNRKEVFRKPANKRFWTWLADFVLFRMLNHRFYALRVKNKSAVERRKWSYPSIIYAPHANWWDGIVFYNIDWLNIHQDEIVDSPPPSNEPSKVVHSAICNGCHKQIVGIRYKRVKSFC